ncbi:MAG: hypothetical protein WD009_10330 [Phycisphaeraceae bacterium]
MTELERATLHQIAATDQLRATTTCPTFMPILETIARHGIDHACECYPRDAVVEVAKSCVMIVRNEHAASPRP